MNHLKVAHSIWKSFAKPGMSAIDATAGNGHDTLFLANLFLTHDSGRIDAFDIQKTAIENTDSLLKKNLSPPLLERVHLHHQSHTSFPETIPRPNLIVYNLGYLPGGDKSITTIGKESLKSCQNALSFLLPGGLLSITTYPGHKEGVIESALILSYASALSKEEVRVFSYTPLNSPTSPVLLIFQKQSN